MKKTAICGASMILFLTVVLANTAIASATPYDQIYMTGASNSTVPKDIFEWDETPWLYLKLNADSPTTTNADWNSPAGGLYQIIGEDAADQELWFTLSDWDAVKTAGYWTVDAVSDYGFGSSDIGQADFIVTPEPVSSVLLLVGGAMLFARRRRKKS